MERSAATVVPIKRDESPKQMNATPNTEATLPIPATTLPIPATTLPIPATTLPIPATELPIPATDLPIPATQTQTNASSNEPISASENPPASTSTHQDVPGKHEDGRNSSRTSLSTTVTTTSKTAPPVTVSITAKTPPPVTVSNPTQNHVSTPLSPTVRTGVLIGAVLAAVVLLGAALFICYFRVIRRRRLAQTMMASTGNGAPSGALLRPRQGVVEPYIFSESALEAASENPLVSGADFVRLMEAQQHSPITKGSQRSPVSAASNPTVQRSMDSVSVQRGHRSIERRAIDAGPVEDIEDEDDGASTLPPDYTDVFNVSRSHTVSSRR